MSRIWSKILQGNVFWRNSRDFSHAFPPSPPPQWDGLWWSQMICKIKKLITEAVVPIGEHIFSLVSTCALVIDAEFLVSATCLSPQILVCSILHASLESWCQCLPYKTIMSSSCGGLYCSVGSSFCFPVPVCIV